MSAVNTRELHVKLGVGRDFSNWIKERIAKYEFVEGVDFIVAKIGDGENKGFQPIEYYISLEMAKELSMVENNAQGKAARRYFIECERALKESSKTIESDPTLEIRKLTELVRETTRLADAVGIVLADTQGFMIGVVKAKTGFDLKAQPEKMENSSLSAFGISSMALLKVNCPFFTT